MHAESSRMGTASASTPAAPLPVTTLLKRAAMAKQIGSGKQIEIKPAAECLLPKLNLTGVAFGRLSVLEFAGREVKHRKPYWLCRCECGRTLMCSSGNLLSKCCTSCGCLRREMLSVRATTHGMRHSSEYEIWSGMIKRCHNKNSTGFCQYGAKGIEVCERWRTSFENFLTDMGLRPSPGHSVDRVNTNCGYYPENCRWATHIQQANNKRNNVMLISDGVTKTIAEWARHLGVSTQTLHTRHKAGWTDEEIVQTPINVSHRTKAARGLE